MTTLRAAHFVIRRRLLMVLRLGLGRLASLRNPPVTLNVKRACHGWIASCFFVGTHGCVVDEFLLVNVDVQIYVQVQIHVF